MNNIFVPSTLHVVASGVDVSKDLESTQNHSLSSLLKGDYEEKKEDTTNY